MKVFVTGATGFLGQQLLAQLHARGDEITAIYRPPMRPALMPAYVNWIEGDILDIMGLENVMQNAEQVYHCAAVVSFAKNDAPKIRQINVDGTANVVNIALKLAIPRLLYVSSVGALGRESGKKFISEKTTFTNEAMNSVYAKSKFEAEMEVWRGIAEGLNAAIINPSVILGKTHNWQQGTGAIFEQVWKGFPFYTKGGTGFVEVKDVAKAAITLANSDIVGERFIISGSNQTHRAVFSKIAEYLHKKPPTIFARPWMTALYWRVEVLKAFFSGKSPLITRETVNIAQAEYYYDNGKFLQYFLL